jgi:hypothetical protein
MPAGGGQDQAIGGGWGSEVRGQADADLTARLAAGRVEGEQGAGLLVKSPHCPAGDDRRAGVNAGAAPSHPEGRRWFGGDP